MNANMIKSIKAAEAALARQESEEIGDLPPGHPLQEEVERQRSVLNGDLASLPESHPLRRALLEAKLRLENREERQKEQDKKVEIRKAKRIEARQVRQVRRDAEEDKIRMSRDSMRTINSGIDRTLDAMKDLSDKIEENNEQLCSSQMGRASMLRLQRLVQAAITGLDGARIRTGRV